MQTKVNYEWSYEITDIDGDIIDSDFSDTLIAFKNDTGGNIVLVRNEGNEVDGVTDRYWAYIKEDGTLPEYFSDSYHEINIKVPQKFHKELGIYNSNK